MRTARRLAVFNLLSCLLAVALLVTPTAAEGDVQFLSSRDMQLHPILGGITDDPGPFSSIVWGFGTVENQLYLPAPESDESEMSGDPPTVQFNPVSGYPIAVWTVSAPGVTIAETGDHGLEGHDVLFSHFTVGGWATPRLLAEGAADPTLSIDPASGRVHLVYWTPGEGSGIWHREAPADLTSWTEPIRVSDAREAAARPTALLQGDTLLVAYESHVLGLGSTPREIVLAQRDAQGFSRVVLAMTYHAGRNWVHLDSDGRSLLVRWVNAKHQAGWTLRDEDGNWNPVGLAPLLPHRTTHRPTGAKDPADGRGSARR